MLFFERLLVQAHNECHYVLSKSTPSLHSLDKQHKNSAMNLKSLKNLKNVCMEKLMFKARHMGISALVTLS